MRRCVAVLSLLSGCAHPARGPLKQAEFESGILPAVVIRGEPLRPARLVDRMARDGVPGISIAVVRNGKVEWAHAYGFADSVDHRPLTTHSRMLAGSISKPITAFAALRLVAAGRLNLDEDVNKYLRSWKLPTNDFTRAHPVTLAQLLSHTSGIRTHHYNPYADDDAVPTLRQILDGTPPSVDGPIVFDALPGQRWQYSNANYLVVEQLIEDVTGKDFATVVEELVLRPVEMSESTFVQPRTLDWPGDRAAGHDEDGKRLPGRGYYAYPQLAVAGLWTTATDLARFVIAVQHAIAGRSTLLPAALARRMVERGAGDWGLGLRHAANANGNDWFDHTGSDAGFGANLAGSIDGGDGVAVMINTEHGRGLSREVQFTIRRVYGWPGAGPIAKTVVHLDEAQLRPVAGRYQFADGQVASITFDNGHLWWSLRQDHFELLPERLDGYFALAPGEPTFEFRRSGDGIPHDITVTLIGMTFEGKRVD